MKIKFKKLKPNAIIPRRAFPTDAGADLFCTRTEIDEYGNFVCHTDLAMEIEEGYTVLLFPRSSISKTRLALTNAVGVIDCHYRGEVTAKFKPAQPMYPEEPFASHKLKEETYKPGIRICQMVVVKLPDVEFEEVEELSETDRGEGGYGSTGQK